jgi:putative YphP/YqiW family bacilliredoxin
MKDQEGTLLLFINSVCGCAAGNARPALKTALQHQTVPKKLATVFAGQDTEAAQSARSFIEGYPPSSPSMALFKDGKLVFMLERLNIEGQSPESIATRLTQAFDQFC